MGIHGLTKLIADKAPGAIKEHKMDSYFGRKIAVDASMSIYQFLIAVRQGEQGQLTNEAGEVTSHITGMLYRTIRMMEAGIKPAFVFDGKAPTLKGGELAKRKERKAAAEAELTRLQESGEGTAEDIERQQKRLVRASREQSEEVKRLLTLMGVPIVDAPCEAEATCAKLAAEGLVFGTGTEDADALTFGTPKLIKNLNASEAQKKPIVEIDLARALEGLELTMAQFVDLCILMGCDYSDTIKGIGPVKGLELIKKHGNMEGVLAEVRKMGPKFEIPETFPYEEARALFVTPEVVDCSTVELKWSEPDAAGLLQYLVHEKQFDEGRVKKAIERLQKCKGKNSQNRLESFFGPVTIRASEKKAAAAACREWPGSAPATPPFRSPTLPLPLSSRRPGSPCRPRPPSDTRARPWAALRTREEPASLTCRPEAAPGRDESRRRQTPLSTRCPRVSRAPRASPARARSRRRGRSEVFSREHASARAVVPQLCMYRSECV